MKPYDVIVVGELNVDLILNQIGSLPKVGTEILAEKMTLTMGSSSAICACNMSALGLSVSFVGKIGDDVFGGFLLDELSKKGVDNSRVILDAQQQTGATVALSYGQDRAMVTHQGSMAHLSEKDISDEALKSARHLHFSAYFLQPGFHGNIHKLFQRAKNLGLTTSMDVQWDPFERWDLDLKQLLPYVDLFMPNDKEIMNLTGTTTVDEALTKTEPIANQLIVKMGSEGAMYCSNDERFHQEALVNDAFVDSIGAGDSFNAGFLYRFLNGGSPKNNMQFGSITGAINTTASGGTGAFQDFQKINQTAMNCFGIDLLDI